jgi:hypothetical protein
MTESEWLASTDPQAMLAFLRDSGRASERKLRLFAVACCRRIWHLLTDEGCLEAVEVADRYADGLAGDEELESAWMAAAYTADHAAEEEAPAAACVVADDDPRLAACGASALAARASSTDWTDEQAVQCRLLRCLFANPFRAALPIPPSVFGWHDGLIPRMGTTLYNERALPSGTLDVARLAVLADALIDAGCTDTDLLEHLRSTGPHVRGCWAIDLLTGRE